MCLIIHSHVPAGVEQLSTQAPGGFAGAAWPELGNALPTLGHVWPTDTSDVFLPGTSALAADGINCAPDFGDEHMVPDGEGDRPRQEK